MNETENRHSLNTCDWIDEKRALKVKIVQLYSKRPHQHFRYQNARNLCFLHVTVLRFTYAFLYRIYKNYISTFTFFYVLGRQTHCKYIYYISMTNQKYITCH